jgi:hypothetical protein
LIFNILERFLIGRFPAGRAIRCNLFAFQDKKISAAIPNAKGKTQE